MYKMPKYITFDAYGTLVKYEMNKVTTQILGERAKEIDTRSLLARISRYALSRRSWRNIARTRRCCAAACPP